MSGNPPSGAFQYILDDTDPSITYYNDWNVETNDTAVYGLTTHVATDDRSIAVISFQGSYITVFGTLPSLLDADATAATESWSSYKLDNRSLVTFNASLSSDRSKNVVFFQPDAILPDGVHTLVISNEFGPLMLDYFTITPSASDTCSFHDSILSPCNSSSNNGSLSKIDDTSPLIAYIGPRVAHDSLSSTFSLNTAHLMSSGSAATLNFNGTFVAVYGALSTAAFPDLTFTLDGVLQSSDMSQFTPLPRNISGGVIPQILFWNSSMPNEVQHTLVINLNPGFGGSFWLDFILVQMSSSGHAASPSQTTATIVTSQASAPSSSPSTNSAAIVGGVLGAVIFILLCTTGFLLKLRFSTPQYQQTPSRSASTPPIPVLQVPPDDPGPRVSVRSDGAATYYAGQSGLPVGNSTAQGSQLSPTVTLPPANRSSIGHGVFEGYDPSRHFP